MVKGPLSVIVGKEHFGWCQRARLPGNSFPFETDECPTESQRFALWLITGGCMHNRYLFRTMRCAITQVYAGLSHGIGVSSPIIGSR